MTLFLTRAYALQQWLKEITLEDNFYLKKFLKQELYVENFKKLSLLDIEDCLNKLELKYGPKSILQNALQKFISLSNSNHSSKDSNSQPKSIPFLSPDAQHFQNLQKNMRDLIQSKGVAIDPQKLQYGSTRLGQGASSVVYDGKLTIDENGKEVVVPVAIKVFKNALDDVEFIAKEIGIVAYVSRHYYSFFVVL